MSSLININIPPVLELFVWQISILYPSILYSYSKCSGVTWVSVRQTISGFTVIINSRISSLFLRKPWQLKYITSLKLFTLAEEEDACTLCNCYELSSVLINLFLCRSIIRVNVSHSLLHTQWLILSFKL